MRYELIANLYDAAPKRFDHSPAMGNVSAKSRFSTSILCEESCKDKDY
jgi:hypothetical protein